MGLQLHVDGQVHAGRSARALLDALDALAGVAADSTQPELARVAGVLRTALGRGDVVAVRRGMLDAERVLAIAMERGR